MSQHEQEQLAELLLYKQKSNKRILHKYIDDSRSSFRSKVDTFENEILEQQIIVREIERELYGVDQIVTYKPCEILCGIFDRSTGMTTVANDFASSFNAGVPPSSMNATWLLYPEEAYFFMQSGKLIIKNHDGVPYTLANFFRLAVQNGFMSDEQLVLYSYYRRKQFYIIHSGIFCSKSPSLTVEIDPDLGCQISESERNQACSSMKPLSKSLRESKNLAEFKQLKHCREKRMQKVPYKASADATVYEIHKPHRNFSFYHKPEYLVCVIRNSSANIATLDDQMLRQAKENDPEVPVKIAVVYDGDISVFDVNSDNFL